MTLTSRVVTCIYSTGSQNMFKKRHNPIKIHYSHILCIIKFFSNNFRLFERAQFPCNDIHLSHVKCISAIRTPHIPESDRLGVVISDLRSLKEKQDLLYRKRYLRSHPVHSNVFIKSTKTHTEQVMDANFSVVLNEMNNGKAYYVCDNGRICPKPRDNRDIRTNIAHGGARPKTFTHNRDYGHNTKTTVTPGTTI